MAIAILMVAFGAVGVLLGILIHVGNVIKEVLGGCKHENC